MIFLVNFLLGLVAGGVTYYLLARATVADWVRVAGAIAAFLLVFIINVAEKLASL